MFEKIQQMRHMTKEAKSQSVSMRRKLYLYWLSLALAACALILLILSITGGFSNTEKKMQASLRLQQQNSSQAVEAHLDGLEAQCITLSSQISKKITDILVANTMEFEDLNNNEAMILELEQEIYPLLNTVLRSSKCNGIYFVLDATCNTEAPNTDSSRMGMYLRYSDLSSVNSSNKHLVYFRGASEVAREEKIQMHNRWNLEFDVAPLPGYNELINTKVERLAEQCIWVERMNLMDTWEDVALLLVPIAGADNVVHGFCGIELSELYFRLSYPAVDSPYGTMIMSIVPKKDNTLLFDQAMCGTSKNSGLQPHGVMTIEEGKYYNRYSDGKNTYIGLHQNLPVKLSGGTEAVSVTLLSDYQLSGKIMLERVLMWGSLLLFFLAMLFAAHILSGHFVTPIAKIIEAVRKEEMIDGQKSGISEIDELMDYIREISQTNDDSEFPPEIEELFKTFKERVTTLTPMERTVLQYYIDGYNVEGVAQMAFISINTAKKHNTNINKKLGVSTREELMLYIDLFRRSGRIDEITYHGK